MHECIEIFYKNFFYKNFLYDVSFLFLVLNQNVFFLTFFWYINWMFSLIFITKNTKADGILFFNFVNVSNFDWKFHVIKIKLFGKIYVSFCNSSWLMTCKIYVSDEIELELCNLEFWQVKKLLWKPYKSDYI